MCSKLAIIGAGLSGISLACLIKKKIKVEIFEKARGVGGRMSTRKTLPFIFDHGAQYFKINSTDFMHFVSDLLDKSIIKPWSFRHAFFNGNSLEKLKIISNKDKYFVGVPNMDSIVKYLSRNLNINLNTKINKLIKKNDKWLIYDENNKAYGNYNWVVLTFPAEQASTFISNKISFYNSINKIKMKGCFSLMVGMKKPLDLGFDAAYIKNNDISWIALNNSKPNRNSNCSLIINSSFKYAEMNVETSKKDVLNHMLNLTEKITERNLSNHILTTLHQWKYVEAKNNPQRDYFIDPNQKIAVCGDWFINSRVEDAFTSANELSKEIKLIF